MQLVWGRKPAGCQWTQLSSCAWPFHDRSCPAQTFPGRTHALLQEAGIDLLDILREEGFYVRNRAMSAPVAKRTKTTFGDASPVELPTSRELDKVSEQCVPPCCVAGSQRGALCCCCCSMCFTVASQLRRREAMYLHAVNALHACRATTVLRRLVSPVHFSTDDQGRVHRGLDHVPVGDGKAPVLFVGNHQVHAASVGRDQRSLTACSGADA